MPTIEKLNSTKSLLEVLTWHNNTFKKDDTLANFSEKSAWYAVKSNYYSGSDWIGEEYIKNRWKEVTGTNWKDHKNGKPDPDLDWQSIKSDITYNDPKSALINYTGEVKWDATFTLDNKDSEGNKIKVSFNGYYPTWHITARGCSKTSLYQYYYTNDTATGCEVWVLDNPGEADEFRYIFARNYTTGPFPENRTHEGPIEEYYSYVACAGETLKKAALNPNDRPGIFNLNIVSPTSSNSAIVGDPSNPAEFNAEVSTGIPFLLILPGAFNAKIGNKPAKVTVIPSFFDNLKGIYILQIAPPPQDTEGSYDLNVSFSLGGMSDYDIEPNAVVYSKGGSIDVMEVIDRSGSMGGEEIQAAKDSAKLFVDLMRIGDMIGVASYSDNARVDYGLTEITSEAIKQDANSAIDPIFAYGMTSIGAGLQAAYNELIDKGNSAHPWSIILMSDGWQNTAPHPDTVLPDIKAANIKVFTIGLGEGADADLLSHIAHETGGEYYFSPSREELRAIYNSIAGVVKAQSTVKTIKDTIMPGETKIHGVPIDPTIGEATFTVAWASPRLALRLQRPNGSWVDPSDPDVLSHIKGATYETYTIGDPVDGEWVMEITATSSSSSSIEAALAKAGEGDNWSTEIDVPAKLEALRKAAQAGASYTATVTAVTSLTVHMYTDKDRYLLNEPMKIIAALAKAGEPITDATVEAAIERPDAATDYLSLYDDGIHGDGVALDGVYANHYSNTNVSGSYTINIYASGTASPEPFTREVTKSVYVSGAPGGNISVTPTSWDAGTVTAGGDAVSMFAVNSTTNETASVSATDLRDASGNIIKSENIFGIPSMFIVPAGGSTEFYGRIYVPGDAKGGNYTGSLIITSTANSVSIPTALTVLPNEPPIADAGPDQTVYASPPATTAEVTLNGSASYDPDGDPLNYTWTWNDNTAHGVNPTVELPFGTTTIALVVNDGIVDSAPDTVNITVLKRKPTGRGGGGGEGPCYLDIDMLGNITTVRISCATGRTLKSAVVADFNNTHFLEIDYGTTVICPELGEAPEALLMRVANQSPPVPDGSALIGSAYNFTGNYGYKMLKYCSGVTFGKNITIALNYDPDELPESTASLAVAYYDTEQGSWVSLPPDIGRVAEVGKATGLINHFSTVAVIAELAPAVTPASFVASALNIEQSPQVWKNIFVGVTGEDVTITANVANNGGEEGTYIAELKLNGETADVKEVTLAAGQSQQVSFTLSGVDYGQYEVEVAGLSGGFTVSRTIDWWAIFGITLGVGLITWAAIWGRRRWKKRLQPARSE